MRISQQNSNKMVIKETPILQIIMLTLFAAGFGFFTIKSDNSISSDPFYLQVENLFAILIIIIVLFVIAIIQFTTITINKSTGQLNIKRKRLIKPKNETYQINHIKKNIMREFKEFNKGNRTVTYPLFFIMNDNTGPDFEVDFIYSNTSTDQGSIFNRLTKNKKIGTQIAKFIGVPFEEHRAPSIPQIVDIVSAIKESCKESIDEAKKQQ